MPGGLLFAWVPFQSWVKGADVLSKPQQALPADWPCALSALVAGRGPLLSLQSVSTTAGPALRLIDAQREQWLSAARGELPRPDAGVVDRYARTLYRGAVIAALVLVLTGLTLMGLALRGSWRWRS